MSGVYCTIHCLKVKLCFHTQLRGRIRTLKILKEKCVRQMHKNYDQTGGKKLEKKLQQYRWR